MQTAMFLRAFLGDRNVASVTPTFLKAVMKVCDGINFGQDNIFLEYGPGTGAFSRHILRNMTQDSYLLAIERNREFADYLSHFKDERFHVVNGFAEDVKDILISAGISGVDY